MEKKISNNYHDDDIYSFNSFNFLEVTRNKENRHLINITDIKMSFPEPECQHSWRTCALWSSAGRTALAIFESTCFIIINHFSAFPIVYINKRIFLKLPKLKIELGSLHKYLCPWRWFWQQSSSLKKARDGAHSHKHPQLHWVCA